MRVSLLGRCCDSRFVVPGELLQTMTRLNELTGRAVFLASRVGSCAHYIYVCQSTIPGRRQPPAQRLGWGRGLALLSLMDDAEATRIILRNNADRGDLPAMSVRAALARSSRSGARAISTSRTPSSKAPYWPRRWGSRPVAAVGLS
jgi:DNA-binding IclR family transcriptional regulator